MFKLRSKNSRNTSKLPFSDAYREPKPKSLRKSSGRKIGGQEGRNEEARLVFRERLEAGLEIIKLEIVKGIIVANAVRVRLAYQENSEPGKKSGKRGSPKRGRLSVLFDRLRE